MLTGLRDGGCGIFFFIAACGFSVRRKEMADGGITKRALSDALKELMAEISFSKIYVSQICERCGMSRQSFYYHFKDKYDLVNWIFNADFLDLFQQQFTDEDPLDIVRLMAHKLYDNRIFYKNALSVSGQNSLSEHMRKSLEPLLEHRFSTLLPGGKIPDFYKTFLIDASLLGTIKWISSEPCIPPDEFVDQLLDCTLMIARHIADTYE